MPCRLRHFAFARTVTRLSKSEPAPITGTLCETADQIGREFWNSRTGFAVKKSKGVYSGQEFSASANIFSCMDPVFAVILTEQRIITIDSPSLMGSGRALPSKSRKPSDSVAGWIAAAQEGVAAPLGRLFEECRQYLMLIASQELPADVQAKVGASDLVQETFLEAQRDFGQFSGASEAELLAWLRQILLNNIRDASRRFSQAGKRDVEREVSLGAGHDASQLRRELPAATETPSWFIRDRERNARLMEALDRLSDDHRRVIILRNLELLSFADIGLKMGRTPDAARKLWGRAIAALGQELGDAETL